MNDFSAEDLLEFAKSRYGEDVLRRRMLGAGGDVGNADEELLEIAQGVVDRVRIAAQQSVGWPFPGKDPDTDVAYRKVWPKNLFQRTLELFNWRTLDGQESISTDQRKIGEAAEAYFSGLASGSGSWGIFGSTDAGSPAPIAARNRDGSSNLGSVPDRRNLLDDLRGAGWDFV